MVRRHAPRAARARRPLPANEGRGVVSTLSLALLLAFGFALLGVSPAVAQDAAGAKEPTLDEIVARHRDAKGGDALAGLTAIRATGTHYIFSEPAPFTLWRERPNRVRLDTAMLGMGVIESWDGERGWAQQPPAGAEWPLPMIASEAAAAQSMADFDTPLIGWREKGHQVTLAGREDFDGIDAWRLEVERAEGFTETWFVDAGSYLEAGKIGPAHDFGQPAEARTWFDDFRPVAGVMIPHVVESQYFIRHRRLEIEAVEANPELPAGLFSMPPLAGMAKIAAMAGDWQVKVEFKPHPRAPWQDGGVTEATVAPRLGGAALDETIVAAPFGRTVRTERTWTWDRFTDRYRIASLDDYTSHLNVFEGGWGEDGRLVAGNARPAPGPWSVASR